MLVALDLETAEFLPPIAGCSACYSAAVAASLLGLLVHRGKGTEMKRQGAAGARRVRTFQVARLIDYLLISALYPT